MVLHPKYSCSGVALSPQFEALLATVGMDKRLVLFDLTSRRWIPLFPFVENHKSIVCFSTKQSCSVGSAAERTNAPWRANSLNKRRAWPLADLLASQFLVRHSRRPLHQSLWPRAPHSSAVVDQCLALVSVVFRSLGANDGGSLWPRTPNHLAAC